MVEPIFIKMTIFWRSPNFRQALREWYGINLAYGNPPGSSYELFWHRKSWISNFRRDSSLVDQQLGQNSYQIWNLRTLKYREALRLSPPTIFSSPKIQKKNLPLFLYIQKFVKRTVENLFLRYFRRRIRFWYSRNHISSISCRCHDISRFRHHVPNFDGDVLLEIFTDRNPPLQARRYDRVLC